MRDDQTASKAAKKANTIVVGKDSKIIDKSKHKIKKKAQNQVDEREKTKDDAVVEISLDSVLTLPAKSGPPLSLKEMTKGVDSDGDSSDLDGEIEAQEKAMLMKGKGRPNGLKAFEQRDLVSLAFAGDNVVQVILFIRGVCNISNTLPCFARVLKMLNVERLRRMHLVRLTLPFLVG